MVEPHEELKGRGSHSFAGFEYQIDVSIWLALDLVLASKLTRELTLDRLVKRTSRPTWKLRDPGESLRSRHWAAIG